LPIVRSGRELGNIGDARLSRSSRDSARVAVWRLLRFVRSGDETSDHASYRSRRESRRRSPAPGEEQGFRIFGRETPLFCAAVLTVRQIRSVDDRSEESFSRRRHAGDVLTLMVTRADRVAPSP
jgi:hypothetical protein